MTNVPLAAAPLNLASLLELSHEGKYRPSKVELEHWYLTERHTQKVIAAHCNVSPGTIGRWLKKENIPLRSVSEVRLPEGAYRPTKEELLQWYVEEKQSQRSIAKHCGVTQGAVTGWLKKEGIKRRSLSEAFLPEGAYRPSVEELEQWYVEEKQTMTEIGERCGVYGNTIGYWLDEAGIARRTLAEVHLPEGAYRPTKNELEQWYVKERQSMPKIAKRCGVGNNAIKSWLIKEGIPLRSRSESHLTEGSYRPNRDELEKWYVKDGGSQKAIAQRCGVSRRTIGNWLDQEGISRRKRRKKCNKLEAMVQSYVQEVANGYGEDLETYSLPDDNDCNRIGTHA